MDTFAFTMMRAKTIVSLTGEQNSFHRLKDVSSLSQIPIQIINMKLFWEDSWECSDMIGADRERKYNLIIYKQY